MQGGAPGPSLSSLLFRTSANADASVMHKLQPEQTDRQRDHGYRHTDFHVLNEADVSSARAFSTTMMLATEPVMVRLPASVLDIASKSHALRGS